MGKKRFSINKSIDISAPKESVWEVLFSPKSINTWSSEFSEGSRVEGDWELGGTVFFKDKNGEGLKGRVIEKESERLLSVEFVGVLKNGVEDPENEELDMWKGCVDAYILTEKDGVTVLTIESVVPEKYFEPFKKLWDRALRKIRQIAEW